MRAGFLQMTIQRYHKVQESERSSVSVLLTTPFILQNLRQKWGTSYLSYWKSSTRLRRLVDKLPCVLRLVVARPK